MDFHLPYVKNGSIHQLYHTPYFRKKAVFFFNNLQKLDDFLANVGIHIPAPWESHMGYRLPVGTRLTRGPGEGPQHEAFEGLRGLAVEVQAPTEPFLGQKLYVNTYILYILYINMSVLCIYIYIYYTYVCIYIYIYMYRWLKMA